MEGAAELSPTTPTNDFYGTEPPRPATYRPLTLHTPPPPLSPPSCLPSHSLPPHSRFLPVLLYFLLSSLTSFSLFSSRPSSFPCRSPLFPSLALFFPFRPPPFLSLPLYYLYFPSTYLLFALFTSHPPLLLHSYLPTPFSFSFPSFSIPFFLTFLLPCLYTLRSYIE